MKSAVIKSLALSGLLATTSYGLSLYDEAPPIGIPESYAMRYSAHISAGYDTNLNNTTSAGREGSGFVRYGVSASTADYESVTKKTLNANLGGTLYSKDANETDERRFSDISLAATLSHAFSAGSQYTGNLSLTYKPEPDYSNGISAANTQGDCLTWNVSSAYSRMIDCRWSWTANVSYNGNVYTDSRYEKDDRNYLSGGFSLNLRKDSRTTYGLNTTWRKEMRSEGFDSDSCFVNLSLSHSISPTDSFSLSAGTQAKLIDDCTDIYPTLNFTYRRLLTQGLSANAYVAYSNENIDTYIRANNINYLSSETWRVGMNLSYCYTPKVSFSGGLSLLYSDYSKGTNGAASYDRMTWSLNMGMSYRFTEKLSGNLSCTYSRGDNGDACYMEKYNRIVTSAGLSYSF